MSVCGWGEAKVRHPHIVIASHYLYAGLYSLDDFACFLMLISGHGDFVELSEEPLFGDRDAWGNFNMLFVGLELLRSETAYVHKIVEPSLLKGVLVGQMEGQFEGNDFLIFRLELAISHI